MDQQRVAKNLLLIAVGTAVLLALGGYRFYRIIPALRSPEAELFWQLSILLPLGLAIAGWIMRRLTAKPPHS